MDFTLKGIKEIKTSAEITFNRAIQFTGEKLGQCERTELDGYLEETIKRAEQITSWNEKISKSAEMLANSDVTRRFEEFFIEKLAVQEKRNERERERQSNLEWLGNDLLATGQDLTFGDSYASALIESGQTELIIGQMECEFKTNIQQQFIKPLRKLSNDYSKTMSKERRNLEIRRLDLDAAKSKYSKVRSTDPQIPSLPYEKVLRELNEVKEELEKAQNEFDKQSEVLSNTCNRIVNSSEQCIDYLSKFIQAQSEFYYQANQNMKDLLNDKRTT